jgi:hypothetical protein
MKKAIINWWEFKWSENGEIKKERFDTEIEMNKLIENVSKKPGFYYIGVSRDVDYPKNYIPYDEDALQKMQYIVERAL